YFFYPLRGQPKNLDRSAEPVTITVRTEPLFSQLEHDVFFNRGVASSQAYARKFGNKAPDKQPTPAKVQEAFDWLSRDLDDAILRFIKQAGPNDGLLCCFYEFRYRPVADEIKNAIDRGVDVKLIIDAKVNEFTDKHGVFHKSFPREDNLAMIAAAGIPENRVKRREAKVNDIQHNKFMVRLKGQQPRPFEVWTGSPKSPTGSASRSKSGPDRRTSPTAASMAKRTSATGCATPLPPRNTRPTGRSCSAIRAARRATRTQTYGTRTPSTARRWRPFTRFPWRSTPFPRASRRSSAQGPGRRS